MPSGSVGPSGVIASSVSAAIRGHMRRQRVSGNGLAARTGLSQNYPAKRLRDHAPLTLNDVEAICTALSLPVMDLVNEASLLAAGHGEGTASAPAS
jgi:DNA-binding Xre family transcriptional regulator